MTAQHDDLIGRLEQGPCFLFLGQKYLLLESGVDPLAGPVSRAAGGGTEAQDLYTSLLRVPAPRRQPVLAALARSAANLAEPAWLKVVADLPWNGVFSTAIDSLFVRALRNESRTVQPVVSSQFRPAAPRSRTQVQAVLLFGGADQPPESQPPTNRIELGARRSEARSLAQRLPDELITPRGVLIIEAWSTDDWFGPEDLYGMLSRLGQGQAHLFSATEIELEDEYVAAAVESGVLVPHEEDFASYVQEAKERGALSDRLRFDSGGHQLELVSEQGVGLHEVPRDIWNAVSSFGQPIDADLLTPPASQSPELRYARFREFLGASESSSIWSAVAAGLPFRRDYEGELRKRVDGALSGRGLLERPLLLVGQTGTGKTIALASLAYAIGKQKQHAVLHIPRRANRPSYDAIDPFCEWAERITNASTLIVWDGMVDADEYFRLAKYLDSRGRRAVVVGSCYSTAEDDDLQHKAKAQARKRAAKAPAQRRRVSKSDDKRHIVRAPAVLEDKEEMVRFTAHLGSLGIIIPATDWSVIQKDRTFLSALYRLLPETRGPVSGGLVLELRHAESALAAEVRTSGEYVPQTAMAAALHKAGLVDKLEETLSNIGEDGEGSSYRGPYERLVNIVLVVSRHGQAIPLELALRVVGRDGVRNLPQLLGKIDLIRWLEDRNGNYALSARNELEAEILVKAERTSDESEIEAIAEALAEVRPDSTTGGGSEVQFAVDLLNRIGPQGEQEERYAPHFLRIADAFARANGAAIVSNPRLALLETNLCREWVKYAQTKKIADAEKRTDVLRRAEDVVENALAGGPFSSRSGVRANLMVEQASVVGAQIYELLRSGPDGKAPDPMPVERMRALLKRVLRITSESMGISADKYYPVDVVCWVTLEIVKREALPPRELDELLAECLSRLLLIEVGDLSPKQEAKYNARFSDIAAVANEERIADEKLRELAEHDEPLAAYLYALRVSGLVRNDPDPDGIRVAFAHLQSKAGTIDDRRCLRLLVDLFWMAKTGHRFMEGERLTLPLGRQDWHECLELAGKLQALDDLSNLRVEFMRALAHFHLGQLGSAFDAFRKAERQSHQFRRRIVTMYVASDTEGHPRRFHPTVRRVDPDQRKGMCWVEELAREIPFQPHDFGIAEPARGLALPEAFVTFNLRGAILEPARRPHYKLPPHLVSGLIPGPASEPEPGRPSGGSRAPGTPFPHPEKG
ncbi:hypothetical protein [Streptomyces sp. NPDC086023]|uniref:P-loop NTPase n=1 Tax=Streptomyces sp. NPDC086023 TaxID=3365746 RepID=UPI0037D21B6E